MIDPTMFPFEVRVRTRQMEEEEWEIIALFKSPTQAELFATEDALLEEDLLYLIINGLTGEKIYDSRDICVGCTNVGFCSFCPE